MMTIKPGKKENPKDDYIYFYDDEDFATSSGDSEIHNST